MSTYVRKYTQLKLQNLVDIKNHALHTCNMFKAITVTFHTSCSTI